MKLSIERYITRAGLVSSIIAVVGAVVGCGCERRSPPSSDASSRQAVERGEDSDNSVKDDVSGPSMSDEQAGRAHEVMDRIIESARRHYRRTSEKGDGKFPGGEAVEWKSANSVPVRDETYEWSEKPGGRENGGDAGVDTRKLGSSLGLGEFGELPAQIYYETGADKGASASAQIRLMMDFTPEAEADHTLFQELGVDEKTGKVNVFPRLTRHRGK